MRRILLFLLFPIIGHAQLSDRIKLNQVGFYHNGPKLAVITGEVQVDSFYVTSADLKDTLFRGLLGPSRQSAYSKTTTRLADFSKLDRKRACVLVVPTVGYSYPFRIKDGIFWNTGIATLKGFYYQRVSMPLDEKYAEKWHRLAGHPDTAVFIHPSAASDQRPAGTIISSAYGWYDAGDYNKYIVNSGITMGTLLSAYEDFPKYFDLLKTNIPESGNSVPDILDEVLYNLRWMLTMQDPFDGGVYNKCTNANFDGMVMPGVTKEARYVVQKGTAATLDFAAVMAQAARIFKKFSKQLPKLSDSCLNAAVKAWEWAEKNPALRYDQNEINKKFKPVINTGGYGDWNFKDEWFWAAAEMYSTTNENKYLQIIKERIADPVSLPAWPNVGMLGYYTLIRLNNIFPKTIQAEFASLKDSVIRMANNYLAKSESNAFATVMGQSARDYNWGGNSNAANQGILLIRAYLLTNDRKYVNGAISNLDYILGRNATGYSFITGIGSKTPMHPHHRQSEADGIVEPVPGLLVGGPNVAMQDRCNYLFKEIETAFVDDVCSYASNEIAINWNAPIVYLANALEAIMRTHRK